MCCGIKTVIKPTHGLKSVTTLPGKIECLSEQLYSEVIQFNNSVKCLPCRNGKSAFMSTAYVQNVRRRHSIGQHVVDQRAQVTKNGTGS